MVAMAVPLTTAQRALVALLAQHFPTREQLLALLPTPADELPEGLEGPQLWSLWLWGAEGDARPTTERSERLSLLRVAVGTPLAELDDDARDDLLELIAAAAVGETALTDLPIHEEPVGPDRPAQGSQGTGAHLPMPETAASIRKGRLIGFPLLMVGIALALVGYIVVMLAGGLG